MSVTAKWDTALRRAHKRPIVVAEFDVTDGADIPRMCTHDVVVPLADAHKVIIGVGRTSGSVNPVQCTSEIRGTTLQILDYKGFFTTLLSLYEFRERVVTLYLGFESMPEDLYRVVFKGRVSKLACSKPGVWVLSLDDLRRSLRSSIYRDATEADPVTYADVNPITHLVARLTTADHTGLGIDSGLIDTVGMYDIRDTYFSTLTMSWSIVGPEDAKSWLEREICLPLGLYFSTLPSGALTLRKVTAPTGLEALTATAITASEIIGDVQVSYDLRDLTNEILWQYDWDTVDEEFDSTEYTVDSDSLTQFKQTRRLSIESQGMTTAMDSYIDARNAALFIRFADPYPRYKFKTTLKFCRLQPGELVQFQPLNTPDVDAGSMVWLWPKYCEVLSVNVDMERGVVDLEIIGTPFDQTRTGVISTLTDVYADASAGERLQYCWIGRTADNQVYDGASYVDGYIILAG